MIRIFTILILFCLHANATVYYVDTTKSDSNDGLTTSTAWKTIAKVNSVTFNPGDFIYLKAGQTWNERLNVPSSGSVGNVITFGAYGTGVKPIITGLQTLTGFTNVGNIWTVTATNSVHKLNTVLIGGSIKAKGRYPNSGYLTFTSYSGNTQITGDLTGTPDYTGAECVVRTAHWVIDKPIITSQSGGVINFSSGITYTPQYGTSGYFIQNSELVLDVAGEWSYDSASKVLKVYSTASPSIQISTIDTLIHLRAKSYITIDGLGFTGANIAAIQMDTCDHITIINCSFNYSGTVAISGLKSSYVTIKKDSIQNSYSGSVFLKNLDRFTPTVNPCDYAIVDSCYIKNTATVAGMGLGENAKYIGINISGLNPTVTNNRIDSTGYIGITVIGKWGLIKNNYITNYCFVKDDGGGIYSGIGAYMPADNNDSTIIRSNIIINGPGAGAGALGPTFAAGIYCDDNARRITVDSNTVADNRTAGIFLNCTRDVLVKSNTASNSIGAGLYIAGACEPNEVKDNISYLSDPFNYAFFKDYILSDDIDSNFYSRPTNEDNLFRLYSGVVGTFAEWQAVTGYDPHSHSTPTGITDAVPLFYYNPTLSDSTISLVGTYKDARDVLYINSVTIKPYQSKLLFKASTGVKIRVGNLIFY